MGPGRFTLGEGFHGIHWTGVWASASDWLMKPPIGSISGIKRPGREFDHSPFGTEAKSEWSYIRHVYLYDVHRGTFFLLLIIVVIIIIFLYRPTW